VRPIYRVAFLAVILLYAACGGRDSQEVARAKAEARERERIMAIGNHWVERVCGSEPIIDTDGSLYDIPGTGCYRQTTDYNKRADGTWEVRYGTFTDDYCIYVSGLTQAEPQITEDWDC
jgi:hypothetical protein